MWRGCSEQSITKVATRCANGRDLHIFAIRIIDLAVAGNNLTLNGFHVQQWGTADQCVHAINQFYEIALNNEILTLFHESFHRSRNVPGHPT
jgi:hypothetical protein